MIYTLEDYLVKLHSGQWFGFGVGEHTYANLVIHDGSIAKPSEASCTEGLAAMQAEYDGLDYSRKRKAEYDALNQYEMQFDDQRDGTTTWVDAINAIKAAHPKP